MTADDALQTELNAKRAEARLWLHRYQVEANRVSALRREIAEYAKCLSEWQAAHDELAREHFRLQHRNGALKLDFEMARGMEDHFREVTALLLGQILEDAKSECPF